jgi:hypothetical protein
MRDGFEEKQNIYLPISSLAIFCTCSLDIPEKSKKWYRTLVMSSLFKVEKKVNICDCMLVLPATDLMSSKLRRCKAVPHTIGTISVVAWRFAIQNKENTL